MTFTSARSSKLRALVDLVNSAAQTVLREWEQEENSSVQGGKLSDDISPWALYDAGRTVISACGSLVELLQDPQDRLITYGFDFCGPRALYVAAQHRVADHLGKADPKIGLSASQLSDIVGVEENKLSRIMRALCSAHIFAETQEDHYSNNRISAALIGNDPLRAYIMICGKHAYPSAYELPNFLIEDGQAPSHRTAFQMADISGLSYWQWLDNHKGPFDAKEPLTDKEVFALAMSANSRLNTPLYVDFPWESLGAATIVDVGGGIGGLGMDMCKLYPDLKFILQDLPSVISEAPSKWQQKVPEAIQTDRVTFMPHDFFVDNPVKGADVYVLRRVLHDWPDDHCVTILSQLRSALDQHSRLLVMEVVVNTTLGTPGLASAPSPLPANYGIASMYAHSIDLGMLCLYNGGERTPKQFLTLAEKAGLELAKIWSCRGAQSIIELRLPLPNK